LIVGDNLGLNSV